MGFWTKSYELFLPPSPCPRPPSNRPPVSIVRASRPVTTLASLPLAALFSFSSTSFSPTSILNDFLSSHTCVRVCLCAGVRGTALSKRSPQPLLSVFEFIGRYRKLLCRPDNGGYCGRGFPGYRAAHRREGSQCEARYTNAYSVNVNIEEEEEKGSRRSGERVSFFRRLLEAATHRHPPLLSSTSLSQCAFILRCSIFTSALAALLVTAKSYPRVSLQEFKRDWLIFIDLSLFFCTIRICINCW